MQDRLELDVVHMRLACRFTGKEAGDRLAPSLRGHACVAVRQVTAIPIESSGKFRVSKRHFPLDLARSFEGCEGVRP